MSQRVNILISEMNWRHLSAVPKGERSRLVNEALEQFRLMQQRRAAVERMDARRAKLTPLPGSTEQWIREDRDSH